MVEAIANFGQVKVKVLTRHTTVRVQPIFGITPEAFNAIDMLAPDRAPFRLANHDMLTAQPECGIRLPLIGVVQGAFAGMGLNLPHDRSSVMCWDGHGLDAAITLDKPKHDDLAWMYPESGLYFREQLARDGHCTFACNRKRFPIKIAGQDVLRGCFFSGNGID